MAETSEKIIVPPAYDENGRLYYPLIPAASIKDQIAVCYKVPDRAIPVIFLPGVMGSNLKTKDNSDSDKLWRLDSGGSAAGWLFKGANKRKKLLDPTTVVVDPAGRVDDDLAEPGFASRRERGWGQAGYISYGEFLPWLQSSLNDFDNITGTVKTGDRAKLIDANLSLEMGNTLLTREEVGLSYQYLFPVHVMGYNWLDSVESSANALLTEINSIISEYNSKNIKCEKVILVTHSMGGLVARYCSELTGGKSKILGVVHGVLPAIGAPSAYRRMKSGMEYDGLLGRLTAEVAGGNAAEMTAVLSQSPGPLQLLPGNEYGKGWLKIKDGKQTYSLPENDPYTDIYTVRGKWWSLCEENLINPGNTTLNKRQLDNDWNKYKDLVNEKVKPIIEKLAGRYHHNTHAFYGNKTPTLAELIWKGETHFLDEALTLGRSRSPKDGQAIADPLHQQIHTERTVATPLQGSGWKKGIYQQYTIQPPIDFGDGTVPVRSAQIPDRHLKSRVSLPVAHESAYKNLAAQKYTLWAIVKIAQKIKETTLRYADA
ncbi:lipase family alpha/beta hydrolase [Yersinia intermedia]|uniref:lipase family alpha/beta hydrolase n=1 Tax=Yersinia intermedia TaxID=631 RepID=UPI0005E9303C|nr:hypothetical protein [Yersinia intermedia]MCB5297153.1 hypothetical protein [Yersinia intermedia]CNJ01321.1 PGAP1-like protein [Yersinia intermedia]